MLTWPNTGSLPVGVAKNVACPVCFQPAGKPCLYQGGAFHLERGRAARWLEMGMAEDMAIARPLHRSR